jgi:hypothetical protein
MHDLLIYLFGCLVGSTSTLAVILDRPQKQEQAK